MHLSASWTTLALLSKHRAERVWLHANEKALKLFVQHTMDVLVLGQLHARNIANTAYGATRVFTSVGPLEARLFAAPAREVALRVKEFKAQEITGTIWAFATLGQLNEKLFAALAREAALRVREFKARQRPTQFGPSRRLGSCTGSCSPRWRGKQRCV